MTVTKSFYETINFIYLNIPITLWYQKNMASIVMIYLLCGGEGEGKEGGEKHHPSPLLFNTPHQD